MEIDFNNAEPSEVSHGSWSKDGDLTVFFEPHKHGTIRIEDLPPILQASFTNFVGAVTKLVAEKLEPGVMDEIEEQEIRDDYQEKVDAKYAELNPEPEPDLPAPK